MCGKELSKDTKVLFGKDLLKVHFNSDFFDYYK